MLDLLDVCTPAGFLNVCKIFFCSSFKQAYSFGPTFRAENARGRHHLCEFYMIEAEVAFTHTLECIMKVGL